MITDKDIERANRRGQARKAKYPAAVAVRYDDATNKVVVSLANGVDISFPPNAAQGLDVPLVGLMDIDDVDREGGIAWAFGEFDNRGSER